MKFKKSFRLFFVCVLLLVITDTFGRAGGSSSSGGSHGGGYGGYHGYSSSSHYDSSGESDAYKIFCGIMLLTIMLIAGIIPTLLKLKSYSAAKILTRASHKDTFWNAEDLRKHTEKTFRRMQRAWQERDIDFVRNRITDELYANYKEQLKQMKKRHEKNMLSNIHINKIHIIGCEDYKDDSKDRYVAYIKGTMKDYLIDDRFDTIIKNSSTSAESFEDTYHFVRNSSTWLLEKIENTVTIQDIIEAKNFIEK